MTQPPKSPNSPETQLAAGTSNASSQESSTSSPSQANNSEKRVSRYRVSGEEQTRFAKLYGSDLVITMSNAGPGKI